MKAVLLAVAAGLCWGIGEFFTKQVLHTGRIGPITAIAVRSTVALPVIWAVWLALVPGKGLERRDWMAADAGTLAKLVIGSGIIAGAAGMICFYGALHLGPITKVKPIAFALAPVVAVVLGTAALGEPMGARKVIAVVMIVGGVVLLTG
jgi:transporter family protein